MNDIWVCLERLVYIADSFIPEQAFLIAVPFVAFTTYFKVFRGNS